MITGPLTSWACACRLMPSSYMARLPCSRFLFSVMLFLSVLFYVCQLCRPPALQPLCFALPQASLFHFASLCLHLSPCILSPSAPAPLPLHLSLAQTLNLFIYWPLFYFTALKSVCVCVSLSLQWSYGFYLTHNQGQSGFEFFFKTKELKKKWLEQFGMAM